MLRFSIKKSKRVHLEKILREFVEIIKNHLIDNYVYDNINILTSLEFYYHD